MNEFYDRNTGKRGEGRVTRVARLPAVACAHFIVGRCRYEESLNPGYEPGYRCQVLARLESAYDEFLTRADAFALEEELAAKLWRARCESLYAKIGCPDYEPGDKNTCPDCALLADDVCLKRLPECSGRCPRYTLKNRG